MKPLGPSKHRPDSFHRCEGIDAFRGALSLYIVAFHVFCEFTSGANTVLAHRLHDLGLLGVQFFFCASGFLIFQSYGRRVSTESRPILNFYIRRFFRIVPLWWITVIFSFIQLKYSGKILIANLLFYFGLLSFDKNFLPIDVSWSLFVEELFYVLFPWSFKALKSWGIWLLFGLTIIVSIVWKKYAAMWGVPSTNFFIDRFPLAHFQYFYLGAIVCIQLAHKDRFDFLIRNFRGLPITLLDILLIVCVYLNVSEIMAIPSEICICFIFLSSLFPQTLMCKILNWSFFRWVGVRCYFVYIFHPVLQFALGGPYLYLAERWHWQTLPFYTQISIGILMVGAATVLFAGISYRLIERPLINFAKTRFFDFHCALS